MPQVPRRVRQRITAKPQIAEIRTELGLQELTLAELHEILDSPYVPLKFEPHLATVGDTKVRITNVGLRTLVEILARCRTARYLHWILDESQITSYGELRSFWNRQLLSDLLPAGCRVAATVYTQKSRMDHRVGLLKSVREALQEADLLATSEADFDVGLSLSFDQDICQLRLNPTHQELFRRNYKRCHTAVAPLGEHIAAGLIQYLQRIYPPTAIQTYTLYIPFAGSGTLGWEALLLDRGISNLAFVNSTGLEHWQVDAQPTVQHVEKSLAANAPYQIGQLVFADIDPQQVNSLDATWQSWQQQLQGPWPQCQIESQDFWHWEPELSQGPLTVLLNPPFDHRLPTIAAPQETYQRIWKRLDYLASRTPCRGVCLIPAEIPTQLPGHWQHQSLALRSGGKSLSAIFFNIIK